MKTLIIGGDLPTAHSTGEERPYRTLKIYLIGSLRNKYVTYAASLLREDGHEVFDNWHAAGPKADEHWQEYEEEREHSFIEALDGSVAVNNFYLDDTWLRWCDTGVLVLPAGISGHMELAWLAGKGKRAYIILDPEDNGDTERWDLMYKLAGVPSKEHVWASLFELRAYLRGETRAD